MPDYYTTLGVSKDSSPDEIKRAYRRLASQYHPDKGGDTKKFQEIQAAYDTLSDPQKRAAYDNPQPQFQQFGGMPPGFDDFFSMFGEGQHPFAEMFQRRQQKNRNLNMQTEISLEEAFTGKNLTASIKLPSGKEQLCDIRIPRGIQDNTTMRLAGMGDDSFPHLPRGDIHLTVRVQSHTKFHRQNDDLIYNLKITAFDAILGKSFQLETIDNKLLEIKIQPGTQPNTLLSVPGYGMPNINDNRFVGRLLINVEITIPTNLTQFQIDKLKELNL